LKIAARVLAHKNFCSLLFLSVNRNVKREWWTIHKAFGGIYLFSIAVEHTIAMINMFIQSYGAEISVAMKFMVPLEALQLGIGCAGNPLEEDYNRFHILAMPAG
jgi:hypothetical protein